MVVVEKNTDFILTIVAYCYSDPLLETPPDPAMWGVEVDRLYVDLGARHNLQHLITDAQTQRIDYCLLRNLGELAETPAEVTAQLNTLENLGMIVIALDQDYVTPSVDTLDALDTLGALGDRRRQWTTILSQLQHQRRQQALQRGHARNRLKHLPPPGKAPYGYRRGQEQYVLDKAAAPIVKAFFERFLLSGSLRGSIRYLERVYCKKIAVATGKRWLTHPVYRGDLLYQNRTIIPDAHPPLLTRLEAAQIDRLLRRNAPLPPRTASAPRSLTGLGLCARCHTPWQVASVSSRTTNKHYEYLRPKACPDSTKCKAIAYGEFLERTIAQICQALPAAVAEMPPYSLDRQLQALQTAIAEKREILKQLPHLERQGILDAPTSQLRAYGLQGEIAALQTQIDQLPPDELQRIIPTVSLPQFWRDLSETERRFYFREFIQRIQIDRHPQAWTLSLTFVFHQSAKIPPAPSPE